MANQTELLNVSDEMKLDENRLDLCELESDGEMCSSSLDTTEELYSSSVPDTCRVRLSVVQDFKKCTIDFSERELMRGVLETFFIYKKYTTCYNFKKYMRRS